MRHLSYWSKPSFHVLKRGLWPLFSLLIILCVVLPLISVVLIALQPYLQEAMQALFAGGKSSGQGLFSSVLPRYIYTTFFLCISVGTVAACLGTGSAWLLTMYQFHGSRWLQWAMLLPLSIPAYIGAYALVDFFEYAGPVQTSLRTVFGWQNSQDYFFPPIRSFGAAVFVLSFALFPYVFLMARSAFREQSGAIYESSRSLNAGPFKRFWSVGLPLTRPAIVAGTAIVMMEVVSDYGTVSYFAVQTLTSGIFVTWLEAGNIAGAAQIACMILIFILFLVLFEKRSRGKAKFYSSARSLRPIAPQKLHGYRAAFAFILCFIPCLFGFILPVGVILSHAIGELDQWQSASLFEALRNTAYVSSLAAFFTLFCAVVLVFVSHLRRSKLIRCLLPLTTLGYAAPGAVLGIGLLMPLAQVDHWIADRAEALFNIDVGLVLTGTGSAIILAYFVRFFAIGLNSVESAFGRIPPALPMAARSLGAGTKSVLRQIHVPLIRGSVGVGFLLVFVDSVKELPATLLLRPFNFDTLATRVHEKASLEQLEQAAPASILIVCVGLCAVLLLIRFEKQISKNRA